jgi:DNA-binding MarR family transcriptional regulator
MPVFRSQHQAELLMWPLLHPDQEYGVSELADRLGVPLSTLHREEVRLDEAGLIASRTLGRNRLVRANTAHPAAPAAAHPAAPALTQLPKYFPPQLVRQLSTLLRTKVLFGSDFPVLTPARWMASFDELPVKDEAKPLIFKENAARLLGLGQS